MVKKMLNKIQKFEQQKQEKQNKISEIKLEIDNIDANLKKLYSLKKEYEKLESNSKDFLSNLKWGDLWLKKNKKY